MAIIKKRVLILSSSRQIKLSGHTLCISNSFEIGEGFTKNIFSAVEGIKPGSGVSAVVNPFELTKDDWFEIADYKIFLWMHFKDRIRQFGIDNPQIFRGSL
ncbi:hypothetical protein HB364_13655 [Pseudoflavitalea sp. X16]|uniref:hypothetical protein n=1 Tax=Paraflavitalea devenefica TaxID=2716334 RepID=UPI0014212CC4|nr:hypothetical protein [Paraflavitalea devenefica]NII26134.1 hypothetical protein [Paraflavitalea devenefica]